MFPFWELVIAPAIEAAGARRIVEIGALRGDTTILMLERLGPDVELHVIDPVPAFDPSEHEKEFPGRYVFHRDLSHNVLPTLPPVDVALVDGDHNWYTVYHELKYLEQVARDAGKPLPLMILHDVCWPYGRRDLYYSPEQIPEEFRQPYAQAGMMPGKEKLVFVGGLNPTMNNAIEEGGPRNGVMTGVDDFVAEYDKPVRVLVLPIYFGLAIVASEELLAARPKLAELLDWLEGADGRGELLDLAEETRLRAMITQHGVYYNAQQRHARAAERYLDLLKGSLLNEHYMEQELRIEFLARCVKQGTPAHHETLRDPMRRMKERARQLRNQRRSGQRGDTSAERVGEMAYTTMGRVRLDHLQSCLDTIHDESVKGDFVEAGTHRGGGAIFLRGYAEIFDMNEVEVWVADRFRASPPDVDGVQPADGVFSGDDELLPDLNHVREAFSRFDLFDDRVHFLQGHLRDTLSDAPIKKVALLRIGRGQGAEAADALDALYPKVTIGGFVVIEGYDDEACRQAVDEFRSRRGIDDQLERVDHTTVAWRKTKVAQKRQAADADAGRAVVERPARPPLAPPAPPDSKDLTVVVVFYNMRREAERTLHSLSRAYQQGVDDLAYEVIAIDNGSSPDQRLDADFVRSFGPEFRFIDMGDDAASSPIPALNRGVAEGAGRNFALMIDGAHVVTPGVLRFGMLGLETYEPAIVSTQQWYIGPGQQGDVIRDGYDQAYEDRLFEEVNWPSDGYRLFDISHFIGERDWLDGMWESNCLFVPRSILRQVGAFDETFMTPGGGYANLELYERLGSSPDVTFTTILGEGSFHQLHGGTTTNESDVEDRHNLLASYARQYEDMKGRPFAGHRKPIHYVGSLLDEARRTRARRRVAPNFFKPASPEGPDGRPTKPAPIPQDLRAEFLDAYWRSLAWEQTTWLGHKVPRPPTDLVAYQEIIHKVRPDWVIEVGAGRGGRSLFLASICDLVGHGQVLSIATNDNDHRPEHPRITYLKGKTWGPEIEAAVEEVVGSEPNAFVILGTRGPARRMMQEFRSFSKFVPVGSYVVLEDTIVNGNPVWAGFGPGPAEAVKGIVESRGDWAADLNMDKYKLTFNPSGFIKRVS